MKTAPQPASRPASQPASRGVRAFVPALVAATTLAIGYLDLARGGATTSALLLVAGYVVVVPWAIMRTGRPPSAP